MSMFFKIGSEYVWDVSKRIGHLFERQAQAFEALTGSKSGLAEFAMDECEIDPDEFADFLDGLISYHDSANNVGKSLLRGFIGPALVLAQRGGLTIPSMATSDVDWSSVIREIERSMPTSHVP